MGKSALSTALALALLICSLVSSTPPPSPLPSPKPPTRVDVLLLGAGASSITAAAALHNSSVSLLVLEARDYVGGRMNAVPFPAAGGNATIELGGNWVHGASSNWVLWPWVESLGMRGALSSYANLDGEETENVRMSDVDDEAGITVVDRELVDKWQEMFDEANEACTEMAAEIDRPLFLNDLSVADCFVKVGFWEPLKELSGAQLAQELRIAQYYAWEMIDFEDQDRPSHCSTAFSFPQNDGMVDYLDYLITDSRGYSHILTSGIGKAVIEAGLVRLNTRVTNVDYSSETVVVHATNTVTGEKETYEADRVIVTLPLGVMKTADKTELFSPPLPRAKMVAYEQMGFGNYGKIFVVFEDALPFSQEVFKLSVRDVSDHMPWVLNLGLEKYLPGSNMINFHIVDQVARDIEAMSDEAATEEVRKALQLLFGADYAKVPAIKAIYKTSWSTDDLFNGSYSYWPLGVLPPVVNQMLHPVEGKLFFAGEHTSEVHFGFVHGAIESGERAAKEVLAEMGRD